MKLNGYTVPAAYILAFLGIGVWGLRLESLAQANDERSRTNVEVATEASRQSADIKERLIRVEEQTKEAAKDVDEIKDEQKRQSEKLDEILRRLSE